MRTETGPDDARIGIVVVAFNAATTLSATLDRIPTEFLAQLDELIILDDASSDSTSEVAKSWASSARGVTTVVVTHQKNLGYGGNQKAAYELASQRGLDVVVLLHGDGQYDPRCLPALVAPLLAGEADAVFGSRMMNPGAARSGGMPLYKWMGNKVLTRFENRLLGSSLSEFHSGYRAYSVAALDRLPLEHNSDGFDFDTQIIVQLIDQGMRIVELPIPTYYGDEICHVNGMKYAADVVRDVVEYRFAKVGFGTAPWVPTPAEYDLKDGDGSSHTAILDMLRDRPRSRVLDLGCSGGRLAERLRSLGHHVTGADVIEIDGVRERTDVFIHLDIARGLSQLRGQHFDVVVAGDVLEHLPRPLETLREIRSLVTPRGEVILSVPNFGHWYPRMRAATGTFGYDRRGTLDDTHLRFFTRRTLRRFVTRAGFDLVEEQTTGLPLGVVGKRDPGGRRTLRKVDRAAQRMRPQLFAYQFVLRMVPHSAGFTMHVFDGSPVMTSASSQASPSLAADRTEPVPHHS